ncbi:hypothetical protein KVH15_04085 [Streptomyces olivaceus]|uniref:hypothetical protein n=1 Tax=Streptomyces olivaceus TaxID=47716 RepID=UPI001CCDD9AE|nr:hypothetical protein [Streptomyces olivaceus]MBZ6080217.1 hypothetical protein [Streptomyces olivaceus]
MFERFTKDARAVVLGAVEHAEEAQAHLVDAGHLLSPGVTGASGTSTSSLP